MKTIWLTILFVIIGCIAVQSADISPKLMQVSIINDTDTTMCQNTYWLNHNIPSLLGQPIPVCGAELTPGESQVFDRSLKNSSGTQIWVTQWISCRCYECKDNENTFAYKIPEGTVAVRVYHDHVELVKGTSI